MHDFTGLLEAVLFAEIRFHDTISRGRLLNRFGKDFEGEFMACSTIPIHLLRDTKGIDSSLSDNFGRSIANGLSVLTTAITITIVGGLPFLLALIVLGYVYYSGMQFEESIPYLVLTMH